MLEPSRTAVHATGDDQAMTEHQSYLALLTHIDGLVASFEEDPDETMRERVFALLGGLVALHR